MKESLYEKIYWLLGLDLNAEYRVLDIGCGRGELLGYLSDSMNSTSTFVGIDAMEDSIIAAKENYPYIEFHHEKFIDSLPFDNDSFDIVLSVDTLECIPNKAALLDEVFRILKPGGKLVFAHWDWDTQVYNSAHKASIRNFVAAYCDWQQEWMEAADGQMGRRLWGLFEGSGKFKGEIASFTLLETIYRQGKYGFDRLRDLSGLVETGSIDPEEYEKICREMRQLSNQNRYFYSVNAYIYTGEPHKRRMQSDDQ